MKRGAQLAVWAVVVLLAGAIYVGEKRRSAEINAPVARVDNRLLPAAIEQIGIVEVMVKGIMHRFERDDQGLWYYHGMHDAAQAGHEHKTDPKAAEVIDKAMVAFGRMQKERSLPLKAEQDEFGVTRPDIFIMVYRPKSAEPLARYAVGSVATDTFSRYLLPVGSADVVTVPDFHIKNLLGLIDTMKAMGAGKA